MGMPEESLEVRVSNLEGEVRHVTSVVEKMDKKLDAMSSGGKFTWQTFGVIFAIIAAVAGGGAAYVNMVVNPLSEKAASSQKDRDLIHAAVQVNIEKISEAEGRDQQFSAQLIETETQIKGIYDLINKDHEHNTTILALLWKKAYGEDYPMAPYYPQPRVLPNNVTR
jgi:hypothetical protein